MYSQYMEQQMKHTLSSLVKKSVVEHLYYQKVQKNVYKELFSSHQLLPIKRLASKLASLQVLSNRVNNTIARS